LKPSGGHYPLIIDFGEMLEFECLRIEKTSSFAIKEDARRTTLYDYPRILIASRDGDHLPLSSARGELSNIWVGAVASVMPRLSVADGSVIGANAVVTRDTPMSSIMVGIPALVSRFR
jgi:hypothetical protein